MIQAVLFDLGGTLHQSSASPERDLWFARRLIERLADYGVALEGGPELLAQRDLQAPVRTGPAGAALRRDLEPVLSAGIRAGAGTARALLRRAELPVRL